MRSSFITLTLTTACLLGSSMGGAIYAKRDLGLGETVGNVGTAVGGTVSQTAQDVGGGVDQVTQNVGKSVGNIVGRGVPDDAPWNGVYGAQDTTDATSNLGDSLSK
ncbi:hypothetical protein G6F70_003051 [Rhizopus microsporus]|uniref:Uncharacterized protein n=2 Tax=Rhizopus TaxID=4842 RepID=A0A367JFM5_RHIAZ|nr:hypothetical protein G6F71_002254 [Rhizopus microsporus]RCH88758.1 hypothetical protein CU097_007665 [Rhizopus azygosporus]KAG1201560.1 hypothetical protein G6F70_003051 [Rhizopus microsporus]KAG1213642.1 hypothetical protein G6F69_002649 [Rhizopus microsporus]KAG1235727.1 hypothetical protein G6F67_002551 [Rhizopus microsporus]